MRLLVGHGIGDFLNCTYMLTRSPVWRFNGPLAAGWSWRGMRIPLTRDLKATSIMYMLLTFSSLLLRVPKLASLSPNLFSFVLKN